MNNKSFQTFAQLQRALLHVYTTLETGQGQLSVGDVKAFVVPVRDAVSSQQDTELRSCYMRYVRLIALSLNDDRFFGDMALKELTQRKSKADTTKPVAPKRVASVFKPSGGQTSPRPLEGRRMMVSGIGRSGTTMIYQQIARLLMLEQLDTNYRYEPYLWNIKSSAAQGNAFDMAQLHHFGLQTHLETPLFLEGGAPMHDAFADHLFAEQSDRRPDHLPEACLTKVIRGSGRLRSYLNRYPDLKIVACLRNPFDTINSSLGMFSFFGEEFHADDRARFRAELESRGLPVDHLPVQAPRSIEWVGAWWRAFTEETLAVARDFPDNVHLFCHEAFSRDKDDVFDGMQQFLGLSNCGIDMGLSRSAGPSIKATSLTAWDISKLAEHHSYYETEVLRPLLGQDETDVLRPKLVSRYAGGKFSFPMAGSELGKMVPIQLRGMLLKGAQSPTVALSNDKRTPLDLPALIVKHAGADAMAVRMPVEDQQAIKKGKTFGVVITSHNNSTTIIDAVQSCLNQTLAYDEIIVVDDASKDNSRAKLSLLASMYSAVKLRFLESSLGPSGARHIGITELSTDYWTQLDGDDLFWPDKNESEARVMDGCTDTVAFSNILLVEPHASNVQLSTAYDAGQAQVRKNMLARAPQIPRDMTMTREMYVKAGGYNFVSHLYEDWDFKLRLSNLPGTQWRQGTGRAGTVYNRMTPGLSAAEPGKHARALVQHFIVAIGQNCPDGHETLTAFDSALKVFAGRQIAKVTRQLLVKIFDAGTPEDITSLAAFYSSRAAHVMTNEQITQQINQRIAQIDARRAETPVGARV